MLQWKLSLRLAGRTDRLEGRTEARIYWKDRRTDWIVGMDGKTK